MPADPACQHEAVGITRGDGESLGVQVKGAYITAVLAGSPAARAGLGVGMRILAVDGRAVDSVARLTREVQQCGRTFDILVEIAPVLREGWRRRRRSTSPAACPPAAPTGGASHEPYLSNYHRENLKATASPAQRESSTAGSRDDVGTAPRRRSQRRMYSHTRDGAYSPSFYEQRARSISESTRRQHYARSVSPAGHEHNGSAHDGASTPRSGRRLFTAKNDSCVELSVPRSASCGAGSARRSSITNSPLRRRLADNNASSIIFTDRVETERRFNTRDAHSNGSAYSPSTTPHRTPESRGTCGARERGRSTRSRQCDNYDYDYSGNGTTAYMHTHKHTHNGRQGGEYAIDTANFAGVRRSASPVDSAGTQPVSEDDATAPPTAAPPTGRVQRAIDYYEEQMATPPPPPQRTRPSPPASPASETYTLRGASPPRRGAGGGYRERAAAGGRSASVPGSRRRHVSPVRETRDGGHLTRLLLSGGRGGGEGAARGRGRAAAGPREEMAGCATPGRLDAAGPSSHAGAPTSPARGGYVSPSPLHRIPPEISREMHEAMPYGNVLSTPLREQLAAKPRARSVGRRRYNHAPATDVSFEMSDAFMWSA